MDFAEISQRLAQIDTASLADANKQLRVMDTAIRPVRAGLKLIGQARTVRCNNDFLTVIKALAESVAGEVLVIDTEGSRVAVAGELFSTEAARRGLAGLVIDGACRDTARLRTLDLPVYARSVLPLSGTTTTLFETQVPVRCGGVIVNPGDVVFGDDDGLIVATLDDLAAAVPLAEAIQAQEQIILERLAAGEGLLDMLNFDEHVQSVAAGRPSTLRFRV